MLEDDIDTRGGVTKIVMEAESFDAAMDAAIHARNHAPAGYKVFKTTIRERRPRGGSGHVLVLFFRMKLKTKVEPFGSWRGWSMAMKETEQIAKG